MRTIIVLAMLMTLAILAPAANASASEGTKSHCGRYDGFQDTHDWYCCDIMVTKRPIYVCVRFLPWDAATPEGLLLS